MIIEVRTYQLKPASVAEVEKRFGEALPAREKFSKLAAFWHTEVGPLNEIIHVWAYDSFEQRMEIRAAVVKAGVWPPPIREFVVSMQSEIFIPAPFSPALEPRNVGPLFEIRSYTLAPGALPGMMERWAAKIDERIKLSPLVGAWHSELGALNKWVHIWAYKDANERQRVRADAVARGIWPPGGAASGLVVKQENKLVVPASFSPLR
ncbi:MAG: NIPSNAP family protein [Rhodopila sp.]|nr:NIPSNAP family protein [Rhodopila sp.]